MSGTWRPRFQGAGPVVPWLFLEGTLATAAPRTAPPLCHVGDMASVMAKLRCDAQRQQGIGGQPTQNQQKTTRIMRFQPLARCPARPTGPTRHSVGGHATSRRPWGYLTRRPRSTRRQGCLTASQVPWVGPYKGRLWVFVWQIARFPSAPFLASRQRRSFQAHTGLTTLSSRRSCSALLAPQLQRLPPQQRKTKETKKIRTAATEAEDAPPLSAVWASTLGSGRAKGCLGTSWAAPAVTKELGVHWEIGLGPR